VLFKEKDINKNLTFISLAFVYTNILGYLFHLYVSRRLSPVGYGEFIVLYSLMLIGGNIANIFIPVTVKELIDSSEQKIQVFCYLRRFSLLIGSIFCIIGLFLSPFLTKILNISSYFHIWIVCLCWLIMFILSVERGFLQAKEEFGLHAISVSIELTFRLISAFILLYLGFKVIGAISSSFIGLLIALIFLFFINKNIFGLSKKVSLKSIISTAMYISPASLIIYADSLFIRKIFDPYYAGIFASTSILGKGIIGFCTSCFSVFFPKFVKLRFSNFKNFFIRSFLFVCIFYLAVEALFLFFGKIIFLSLFGKEFFEGTKYLCTYINFTFTVTLSILAINAFTVLRKKIYLIYTHLFVYYLSCASFIYFSKATITSYIWCLSAVNIAFLICYFSIII